LREQLAELEHDQWIAWSKNIAQSETIAPARLERWEVLWRPYSELTEAEKNQDREWGDKDLKLMRSTVIAILKAEIERLEGLKEYRHLDLPDPLIRKLDTLANLQETVDNLEKLQ